MIRRRAKRGSAIAEFGPALCILLLCLFFPLLDMVVLGIQYCACAQLVSLQAQKAAQVPKTESTCSHGPVCGPLVDGWMNTGIGQFVRPLEKPKTQVFFNKLDEREENVTVSTTFQVPPFLFIPVCPGVPGLGAPATFTISTQRLLEDPEHQ
jgi:hypothetical protein